MQAVGSGVRLFSPNFFQEHLAGENFAPVDDERLEQVELGRGQCDFMLTEFDLPPREIDGERTRLETWLGSIWRLDSPAQSDSHASQYLVDAEGFSHVVVGSQVKRFDLIAFGILYREHDDRHIGCHPYPAAYFQPAHARQQQIEQDQVRA